MGSQGILLLIELKFSTMMTRLQNITVASQLLKVIVTDNSNVLRLIYQCFKSIISRMLWLPILISHVFQHGLFKLL